MSDACDKTLYIPDDVAITLIVFIGIFISLVLVGTIWIMVLRELRKANNE